VSARIDPRWPPALTILVATFLLQVLPGRLRVFPVWVPYLTAIAILAPMASVALAPGNARWLRIERTITFLFFVFVGATTIVGLSRLVRMMVRHPADIGGMALLSSSIAIWVTNVLIFSLLYWQIDRGGPDARANNVRVKPDWLVPHAGAPEAVAPGWRPSFVDYLFLGYSTATAFSPTDALPLTSRAKMLMMIESTISLVTILMVAARVINILR